MPEGTEAGAEVVVTVRLEGSLTTGATVVPTVPSVIPGVSVTVGVALTVRFIGAPVAALIMAA